MDFGNFEQVFGSVFSNEKQRSSKKFILLAVEPNCKSLSGNWGSIFKVFENFGKIP